MAEHIRLLEANRKWSEEMNRDHPEFFHELSIDQKPDYLWIGCSDSRVPAEQITGARPGEIFVHRNIANLVHHSDLNLMSVLQYAIEVLRVKHVIVCGHYGCGGVRAAMGSQSFGLLNKWIRTIKDVFIGNEKYITEASDEKAQLDRLVELNVLQQALNIAKTSIVQKMWKDGDKLTIHAWVFSIKSGEISELKSISSAESLAKIYHYDFG